MKWQQTGAVSPKSLAATRLQLHYGAYVLGSVAHSVLPTAADDSHSNLGFEPQTGSLSTRELGNGLRLDLDLASFELAVRSGTKTVAQQQLAGQTLAGALSWVAEALTANGVTAAISRREYPDFPVSPIMTGGTFSQVPRPELEELTRWFGNARSLIASLRADEPGMSDARVWPHHFDLGALIPISDNGDQTIGLGFSPGDDNFDEPYFYCSPYPVPVDAALPQMPAGHWTTDNFTSAILTATEIQASNSQQDTASSYLAAAVAACHKLVQETSK